MFGFTRPKSVQQSIPLEKAYRDGIFQVEDLHSMSWKFTDINYSLLDRREKEEMMACYGAFLNALPSKSQVQITLFNRGINEKRFRNENLMPLKGDEADRFRMECNELICSRLRLSNNLTQDKLITVALPEKNVDQARQFMERSQKDFKHLLQRMNVELTPLDVSERMKILRKFYCSSRSECAFDFDRLEKSGDDIRDSIAPSYLIFHSDHFEMGDQVGRVLFIREFANSVTDEMIIQFGELPQTMMISINLVPIPSSVAIKQVNHQIMAVESDIARITTRQVMAQNFNATVPLHLQQQKQEAEDLHRDMTENDQNLLLGQVIMVHLADNLERLNQDTESLITTAQGAGCTLETLMFQQEDGLNTALPYGLQKISAMRSLTTKSTAILMPFHAQELQDPGGIYCGINALTKNLVFCNRALLQNGNGLILGKSGSGKSVAAKAQLQFIINGTEDEVIVVDPEGEYGTLIRALSGEVITISASSQNKSYINAMDIANVRGEKDSALVLKINLVLSIFEQLTNRGELGGREQSIIKRCMDNVYREYLKSKDGLPPTLKDLYEDLLLQKEPLAQDLALVLERLVTGELDIFARQTNVNSNNRVVCYDINSLDESLKSVGLLIMLDNIYNRVVRNRNLGRRTWIYIDEIHLFFSRGMGTKISTYSSEFLGMCWKRFRKYGGMLTGITQNAEDCLATEAGRSIFSNSAFILMLNQDGGDLQLLQQELNLSSQEVQFIHNVPIGHGLIKAGHTTIPVINELPKDTELYRLASTSPGGGGQ